MEQERGPRVIVALDAKDEKTALRMAKQLSPTLCRLKIGKTLFTAAGPGLVEALQKLGFEIFLDLKFHDIPAQVAGAVSVAAALGVWMVDVHALGGPKMLAAAKESLVNVSKPPLLLAVTVLTSTDAQTLTQLGVSGEPEQVVMRLAHMSLDNELDGIICSAQEAVMLRQHFGDSPCLVTPGIRPLGASQDDQVRVVTPSDAISHGVDYLVIGRPITESNDPLQSLKNILSEIE